MILLSDSLSLENISVSPFGGLAKRTKEKHLHESVDAEKMTIIPSFDESATKSTLAVEVTASLSVLR